MVKLKVNEVQQEHASKYPYLVMHNYHGAVLVCRNDLAIVLRDGDRWTSEVGVKAMLKNSDAFKPGSNVTLIQE